MPPFRKPTLVTLRRQQLAEAWGFRLAGGVNQGQPILVQKVIPESIAYKNGLREGDLLVRIGNITLKGLTHEEVQEIILRCISTIDLFVIRNPDSEESENRSPVQMNTQYNAFGSGSGSGVKSLTEQVLNRMAEDGYSTANCVDYNNPSSPPLQQNIYVKEREMYEYTEYSSPKKPQSPTAYPPSGRPFSPVVSPTNISYHKPEEQLWLQSQHQSKDTRVFAASPKPQSPSPVAPNDNQRDARVFGVRGKGQSPSTSPVINGSRPTTSSMTPSPTQDPNDRDQRETKVLGMKSPTSPPPLQDIRQLNISNYQQNQRSLDSPQDKQFYAQNSKKDESFKNPGYDRPEIGRVVNDRRVFAHQSRPRMQKFGGSLDSDVPHWKTPLPQLQTVRTEVNQLLPSQTKRQQTYIVQTPPTEKNTRPPPTGTLRRRIRPVWPPVDANGRYVPRMGFSPDGRDSPSRRYDWPPSKSGSVERDYEENGMTSPQMRYSTPPPGALQFQRTWNPRSGSETPPGVGSYAPHRRVQNTAWPPPSNATPAGRSGYRPQQSLPGSRRSSQADDYYVYTINKRIPQSYRPPPNTVYNEQSYHYDTD